MWSGKDVFAIDTKGSHLHKDAMRKLVQIKPADSTTPKVFVRFVSPGLVDDTGPKGDEQDFHGVVV